MVVLVCAQADAASGKLQLKDSGALLQEGISETAARLAQALSTLAQHGAAEPQWPPQCFHSSSLHFVDADGQVQVCVLPEDALLMHVLTVSLDPQTSPVWAEYCCLIAET